MPLTKCIENGKPGYKWGKHGNKCYTYDPDSENSKNKAKSKAIKQGIAIGDFSFEGVKVSFDYHETLTTDKGKEYLKKEMDSGNIIYIISASHFINDIRNFGEKYGIPKDRIYALGSNQKKIEKIKELNIVRHYDNSKQVEDLINENKIKVQLIKV